MSRLLTRLLQSLALLLVPLAIISSGPTVAAVGVFQACSIQGAGKTDICNDVNKASGTNPIIKLLRTAIQIIALIAGIAAVIMIIVAGLTFVTSGSDPKAVAQARTSIVYALIGLAIATIAEALVKLVLAKL